MSDSTAAAAITLKSPSCYCLLTLVVGMGQTVVVAIIPILGRQLFADADLGIALGTVAFTVWIRIIVIPSPASS